MEVDVSKVHLLLVHSNHDHRILKKNDNASDPLYEGK